VLSESASLVGGGLKLDVGA